MHGVNSFFTALCKFVQWLWWLWRHSNREGECVRKGKGKVWVFRRVYPRLHCPTRLWRISKVTSDSYNVCSRVWKEIVLDRSAGWAYHGRTGGRWSKTLFDSVNIQKVRSLQFNVGCATCFPHPSPTFYCEIAKFNAPNFYTRNFRFADYSVQSPFVWRSNAATSSASHMHFVKGPFELRRDRLNFWADLCALRKNQSCESSAVLQMCDNSPGKTPLAR